jgi:hypothetical protein
MPTKVQGTKSKHRSIKRHKKLNKFGSKCILFATTLPQPLGLSNEEGRNVQGVYHTGREEKCIQNESLKEETFSEIQT